MYLLHRAPEFFPGADFAVVHCNFHLRGEESDGDEAFVRKICRQKGLQCLVCNFDTAEYASRKGISIEMAARELRYERFRQICKEQGFDAVAVAHNANDNAETMVLNLLRGTGTRGLRGMGSNACVLRPMLGIGREEIRAWMTDRGLVWREDSSNSDSRFRRNLIRGEVFPLFEKINPSFVRTLNEDMKRIALVDDIAEDYFREASEKIKLNCPPSEIDTERLLALKHWKYVLFRMLEPSGINADQFAALVRALSNEKETTFAGKTFGPVSTASGKIIVGNLPRPEYSFTLIDRSDLKSLKPGKGRLILDADKLPSQPVVREWREGDWMQPLGMRGKKKLSDMFVDLKWSSERKKTASVIELEGSHTAALLCERIDEKMRVTEATRKVLLVCEIQANQ